ncbi:MAG TPA: thiamine-phosphate kinase [Methanomassiliicoccales archaeon]|nr:thiamine-phosphate kinase [Methanomassiliicoccales archaeon]
MKLSDIGERDAVQRILAEIAETVSSTNIGPGDDAAAIDLGAIYLVASTDMLAQKTHFLPQTSHHQMGWTVAAANLSDIAAMGAKPIGMLVSMGLPRNLEFESLDEIVQGILDCCQEAGTELLGGDTKEASEIVLTGTALGTVAKRSILLRRGAQPGDLLAVTGTLGLAAAGYQSLTKGLNAKRAERVLLEPRARVKEGQMLSTSGAVTSCMDISDGLALSVHALSEASRVGFEVDFGAVPVEKEVLEVAKQAGMKAEDLVLYFGGDYQLLFTFKQEGLNILRSRMGNAFTVIGRAKAGADNVLIKQGRMTQLERRGYEHFC